MATYNSNLVVKKQIHRGIYSGKPYDVSGVIRLASGTVLTTADVFLGVPIGENQRVNKVRIYADGATGALAVSLGSFQILGPDGQPLVVERYGPLAGDDGVYTSPASDPDAYGAAAVVSTAREVLQTTGAPTTGPLYVGAAVTTGATLANDVELFIGVELDGETSDTVVSGLYPDGALPADYPA